MLICAHPSFTVPPEFGIWAVRPALELVEEYVPEDLLIVDRRTVGGWVGTYRRGRRQLQEDRRSRLTINGRCAALRMIVVVMGLRLHQPGTETNDHRCGPYERGDSAHAFSKERAAE